MERVKVCTLSQSGFVGMVLLFLLLTFVFARHAHAQPGDCPGYGTGYGMMGYGGPGMMGGGYGMGPGMMGGGGGGGWGMGPGMMGPGGGYGPGMMGGGYGAGPGMMGGNGYGPLAALNLTGDQREKIAKINSDQRKRQWDTMGKLIDEQEQLNELYASDNPDTKKIGAVYGNIAKLQQQMAEARLDGWNRVQGVLTKEQKDQLNQWRRGGAGPGSGGPGPGRMMR